MPDKNSHYNKKLKPLARNLRNNSTFGEVILWSNALRAQNMCGYKFNRQFAIKINDLNIIVDFICRKLKLIIEVDGYSHNFKHEEDKKRDETLKKYGYYVLRVSEHEVKYDLNNVIRTIEFKISELEKSIPLAPFSKGD